MWFQDLFNYDFRRTEMCIIPYATQQGEICFCAYNTGIGWRNIIEKMHMTATLTKWYDEHGRHEIFAGNKTVPLSTTEHSLKLNAEAVAAGAQTDLDKLGIAKNAREEQMKARKAAKELTPDEKRHHAEMEKLYRQHVLKEEPACRSADSGPGRRQEEDQGAGRPAQAGGLAGLRDSGIRDQGLEKGGLLGPPFCCTEPYEAKRRGIPYLTPIADDDCIRSCGRAVRHGSQAET